jgi:hypothetical protein
MHWRLLLSQALTVLTLVVAGLVVVPAGALAHEGHTHTVPSATVVKQAADILVFDAARITLQDVSLPHGHAARSLLCFSGTDRKHHKAARVDAVIRGEPAAAQPG